MRTCQQGGGKAAHMSKDNFFVLRMQVTAFMIHSLQLLSSSRLIIRYNQVNEMFIAMDLYTVYQLEKHIRFIFWFGLGAWAIFCNFCVFLEALVT